MQMLYKHLFNYDNTLIYKYTTTILSPLPCLYSLSLSLSLSLRGMELKAVVEKFQVQSFKMAETMKDQVKSIIIMTVLANETHAG